MSMGGQKTTSQAIPTIRRVAINDAAHMPHDYSTTPGGTLFSTTPGGTRIIYDRKFLLDCRSSPLARTPPCCLPDIPGVTSPPLVTMKNDKASSQQPVINNISPPADKNAGEDAQFEMDI
ncbi:eukaryotic translation initiation factor 4E-binding protein 2-like [Myxocyprinus asiaticus]|uniref:eukaryotic translation initiation factor 4E-binding protein 2-like n=1 Tax=Myxocyprinus asiaticus TaxID=70543 RepID=UPI002223074E|nr:eukaryotic translation initiation factor 4E-binding protein 2-like [Myxocyprinus asiaticus]XP_051533123.1 eukaryotic translation initiation factor 4E-binding protein 2-like [Myxocyprinus asiaticus]XP_051533124.1 eukaryotic translation initiation factor 4E-binding protein 2-like [Myxocyprinus asiaticus]